MVVRTQKDLAFALGEKGATVRSWVRDGMPAKVEGGYSIPTAVRWLRERDGIDGDSRLARTRSEQLRAQKLELDIAERLGRMLPVEDVEEGFAARVAVVRQGHENVIARASEEIGETPEERGRVREILARHLRQVQAAYAADGAPVQTKEIRRGRGRPRKEKRA